ncbi:fungal-specific transcription factor domain-containing protein [Coniochaeta sp. 2T2.1]|nr:fungal-specific transcription factor domain-containing protein [Coniochaeta sp. 2T2.1]
MPSSTSKRPLECSECLRSFSRPSHLSRHQATHLMPAHRGTIPCTRCDMAFSRRDVLLRHMRSAHQFEGRTRRSVQRSCFRCVDKKLKCERTRPCSACCRSDTVCEYPSHDGSEGELFSNGRGGTDSEVSMAIHDESATGRFSANETTTFARSPAYGQQNGSIETGLLGSMATPDSSTHTSMEHQGGRTYEATGSADLFTDLDTGPAISSSAEMAFQSFMPDMDCNLYQSNFAMASSGFPLMQPSFSTGGLDWLGVQVDDGSHDPGFGVGGGFDSLHLELPQTPGEEGAGGSARDGGGGQPPHGHGQEWAIRGSQILPAQSEQLPSLPWPFDQGKDSVLHPHRFPPLREVLSENWRTNRPTQPTLVDGFIHILSGFRLPQLSVLRENEHVCAFHDFQRLVDLYFARFHDIQAIIHRPTWDLVSCPTVLLAAMACMGAMLSDSKTDAELSPALSDICSAMITWMGASDGTNYSDISYLNALCIHQIYSLGSGNRQLYQSADRSRGILIGGLRGVGLLQSRLNVSSDEEPEAVTAPSNDEALGLEWRGWITRESGRRAAWAAFEYDCSLCTLTSRRGIVDLSELPAFLPCADYIWTATTAQAWYALKSRLGANNVSPRLSEALKLALAGRELPSVLGFWAKRLCSQFIGRLLWDLKQLEVMAMPKYCGLGSLISAHRDSKASLLKGLNSLVEALSAPSSTSDLISYK